MMFFLARATRAATARAIAPGFHNPFYRQGQAWQMQCAFAAQPRFACGTTPVYNAVYNDVYKSSKLARRVGRPPLPPWSEAKQQAVRRFWEGLSLPLQRVALFITLGKTQSLYRKPRELERRIHEMRKLIPGVKTTAVAQHALLQRKPETLAINVKKLQTLLSISDKDLHIVLHKAPHTLTFKPEVVAERFAAWRTFFAVDHAQMVRSLKQSPELVCHNNAIVRSRLQVFLDIFESYRLGNRHLALQIFTYHPRVVVLMSCERATTRCKRLATEVAEVELSTWPVWTWHKALTCRENVLDRLLFCRQHAVHMAASSALGYSAAYWHKRFPEFIRWQQQLAEASQAR
eukprot:jgi/Chlat1/4525/Chrsp29S04448